MRSKSTKIVSRSVLALALVLGILVAAIIYGVGIEPRFLLDLRESSAPLPGVPDGWNGARVVVLADQQTGMWWDNDGMVEDTVERALELKPDLILLAGDFIYHGNSEVIDEVVKMVRPLGESGIPTFAVLGNHDYSMNAKSEKPDIELAAELDRKLEATGIQVLENESVSVSRDGDDLYVVGIGSHWAGRDDPDEALRGVPEDAARIGLMHNPASWRKLPANSLPTSVAGHTHGGQLRVPFFDSKSWLNIAKEEETIADGWVDEEHLHAAGNWIYVNRGIGFSTVPMRFNCRPELTIMSFDTSILRPPEDY